MQHRLDYLDSLRGIATLGVVAVHVSQEFPTSIDSFLSFGRFGVQLFFMISAFTMCYMWCGRDGEDKKQKKFYIRRLMRIVPLFWLAILFNFFIYGFSSELYNEEGKGLLQVIATMFFLHGLIPNTINSVVEGGWTISVEVLFYLLFPFLFRYLSHIKNKENIIIVAMLIYFFNVLIFIPNASNALYFYYGSVAEAGVARDFIYMNIVNQLFVFALGIFVYFNNVNTFLSFKACKVIILWIILTTALYFYGVIDFRSLASLGINLILLLIFLIFRLSDYNIKLLSKLGENSYGIYLSHFFFLDLLFDFKLSSSENVNFIIMFMCVLICSYFTSRVLWHFIDRPMSKVTKKLTSKA
jgi:exopolysaccharide production protein ExoZ